VGQEGSRGFGSAAYGLWLAYRCGRSSSTFGGGRRLGFPPTATPIIAARATPPSLAHPRPIGSAPHVAGSGHRFLFAAAWPTTTGHVCQ